jgi:ATP-dependent Clp protease ATP-binding subunit ClpA
MMSDKLEHFTQSARDAFTLAQEEARRLDSAMVGTGHLLVGLARLENRVPIQALRAQGVEPGQVRQIVEAAGDEP